MSEDTKDLTDSEKLDRILAEMSDLKSRLAALETRSAETTRPLLDKIIVEVIETREALRADIATLRSEFSIITADIVSLRARGDNTDRRLSALEQRPS